jgi:endonuclease-8
VPEGDTILRAARTLHEALAGRRVTGFTTVFPQLSRIDHDAPIRGRTIERADAAGKHLLIWFSGDLVLRTHMRMHGSWHIYRPGERWQRPGHEMRITIETADFHAVAFTVPVAEFLRASEIDRSDVLRKLGPDLLAADFDAAAAVARIASRADLAIADALLDQSAIAGIGNIYKSEALFAARINPFTPVTALDQSQIARVVEKAVRLMRASVGDARLSKWVYRRTGEPCRRCGTRILSTKQGVNARTTYWCPRCQPKMGSEVI